jgi:predicted Zn-dependent peptidase
MKVSLLAALESSGARAQQLARHLLVYGRPLTTEEMVVRIDRLTIEDIRRAGARMLRSAPTVTAIGKVRKVLDQDRVVRRLGGV